MRRALVLFCALAAAAAFLPGCKATYDAKNVKQTIAQMCEKEYGVQVEVLTRGKTIAAAVTTNDLLQSDLSLSDHALEKIEHAMLTVSRVTLSSEFPYDFFVIIARDYKSGLQVSFVRYLKDVRRLMTDDISRNDYFQRMLIEAELLGPVGSPVTLTEHRLPDFLTRQIAERTRQELEQNVVVTQLFRIEDVTGEYVPLQRLGERTPLSGTLRLTLVFHPAAPVFETVATPALRQAFTRSFLRQAQTITRRYDFYAFEGLELVDVTGRKLAYFDRKEFNKDTVNTLMELIQSIKAKGTAK